MELNTDTNQKAPERPKAKKFPPPLATVNFTDTELCILEKILKLQKERLTSHGVVHYDKTYFDYADELAHMDLDQVHDMHEKIEAAARHIRKHFKELKNGQTQQTKTPIA